jgi:hypothetical protein
MLAAKVRDMGRKRSTVREGNGRAPRESGRAEPPPRLADQLSSLAARDPAGIRALSRTIGNRAVGAALAAAGPARTLARFQALDLEVVHPEFDPFEDDRRGVNLRGSVGRDGDNLPDDVLIVQAGLIRVGVAPGETINDLEGAIESYQRDVLGFKHPDGRVDPNGQTIAALQAGRKKRGSKPPPEPKPPGPKPPGPQPKPPGPSSAPPDFSPDVQVDSVPPLEIGDHVWYWHKPDGTARAIVGGGVPKTAWGLTTDFTPHSKEIYNFVVFSDQVKCGQPQRAPENIHGSFAWLNNNPGNLTGSTSLGQIPGKTNGAGGGASGTPMFMIFPDWNKGLEAIEPWLRRNGPRGTAFYQDIVKKRPSDVIAAKQAERRAKYSDQHIKYIDMTLLDAWTFYCPSATDQYALSIARDLGVKAEEQMLSALTGDQWTTLKNTVVREEGTIPGWTYSRTDARLPASIRAALP